VRGSSDPIGSALQSDSNTQEKPLKHGVSNGRLDTHARGAARDDQVFHRVLREDGFQASLIEATESTLSDHDVAGLRCQLRDDATWNNPWCNGTRDGATWTASAKNA
jgi:hypothetical protein